MDDAAVRLTLARVATAIGGRRRLLSAAFAAVAVVAALRVLAPSPPPTVAVWAAAHDLAGGRPLTLADLRTVALPLAAVPHGALRADARVVGRLLAAPMRRGEPLTDVRLLQPSLLAALPQRGLVAVPVRVADGPAALALAHPGDLVDVLAVADPGDGGPTTRTVADRLQVLAVPASDATGDGAGLVVLAATPAQAGALAQASATGRLSLALQRP